MPYLQILPVSGSRLLNLFRLLAIFGLIAYPFQTELRSPSNRTALTLQDGTVIEGILAQQQTTSYHIYNVTLPESGLPAALRPSTPGAYIVAAENVKKVSPVYTYHLKGILLLPFKLLFVLNIVWLLHLPAFLFWILYELTGVAVTLVNWIHAIITEQNHTELSQFLARVHLYRFKFLTSFSSEQIPHIDILGKEKTKLPVRLSFAIATEFQRSQVILRFLAIGALYGAWQLWLWLTSSISSQLSTYIGYSIAGLIALPFALAAIAQIILWLLSSFKQPAPNWLLNILYGGQKFVLHLVAWMQGLTSNPSVFSAGIKPATSGTANSAGFDPSAPPKIEMNLLVLLLLIVVSGGMYSLVWIGRTARMMHDDPFTVLAFTILFAMIPFSVIAVRYYRRSEFMLKTPPSLLFEILMILPGSNLIFAPFIIQHGLNNFAKMQSKAE